MYLKSFYLSIILCFICLLTCFAENPRSISDKNNQLGNQKVQDNYNNNLPCWAIQPPQNCDEYIELADDYIFLVGGIITEDEPSESLTESQIRKLKATLRGKLVENLKSQVKVNEYIKKQCSQSKGENINCESVFSQNIEILSKGELPVLDIEIDKYKSSKIEKGNKWEIHGFGKIPKTVYDTILKSIKEGVPIKSLDFSFADGRKVKDRKNNDDSKKEAVIWLRTDECDDIVFKNFPDGYNPADVLVAEVEKMLDSINDKAIYEDPRVFETNSEIFKTGKNITLEEINNFDGEIQKELDKTIRCYEKEIRKGNENYFDKQVRLLRQWNKSHTDQASFKNLSAEWENLVKQISHSKNEAKMLKQIYKERLNLLPHTYLAFVYANARRNDENIRIINEYADSLIEKRLKEKNAQHYIEKRSKISDGFASVILQDSFNVEIQKSNSDGIEFKPITGQRAKIQKYRMIHSPIRMQKDAEDISDRDRVDVNSLNALAFIVLGIEDILVTGKDYDCINCNDLASNSYNDLIIEANKVGIDLTDKKYKIQDLIKEVVRDNYEMVKNYLNLRDQFKERINKNYVKIKNLQDRIEEINRNMKELLDIKSEGQILPTELKDENQEQQLKIMLSRREDYLKEKIGDMQKKVISLKRNKEVVAFSIIEKTEELKINALREHIEKKYHELLGSTCPSQHSGTTIIKNNSESETKESIYRTHAVPVAYNIPIIRIKNMEGSDSKQYSIGVALKMLCQQASEDFQYFPETKEIVDFVNENNLRWEIADKKEIPKKRPNENSEFTIPDYYEYMKFCEAYNNFLKGREWDPFLESWPKIECLKHFEYDPNENIIIDYVRREHWKIKEQMTFGRLISGIRHSEWNIQSYEKIEQFFRELQEEKQKGFVDEYIINRIIDRKFWTSSRIGDDMDTILFDGESIDGSRKSKKDENIYGIILKRF